MTYSLEDFCADTKAILDSEDNRSGRDRVRQNLEKLLGDEAFLASHVGSGQEEGVTQIYEDPNLGFCVLAYNMDAPRTSPPHDHGSSWAVYGQAEGYTDMTIWEAAGDDPAAIAPVREFRLDPGQAGLFDSGEIHSIQYNEGARFVRVTGVDMSRESRRVYDPEAGTMREVEAVGTTNR